MFCHAWALKAWHLAKAMDVDTTVERNLKLLLRGVLTAGRGQTRFLDAGAMAPGMRVARPRRRRTASR
jgi:hypothetical protein